MYFVVIDGCLEISPDQKKLPEYKVSALFFLFLSSK